MCFSSSSKMESNSITVGLGRSEQTYILASLLITSQNHSYIQRLVNGRFFFSYVMFEWLNYSIKRNYTGILNKIKYNIFEMLAILERFIKILDAYMASQFQSSRDFQN